MSGAGRMMGDFGWCFCRCAAVFRQKKDGLMFLGEFEDGYGIMKIERV